MNNENNMSDNIAWKIILHKKFSIVALQSVALQSVAYRVVILLL